MIDHTGMTIEAYLRQTGIKPRILAGSQPLESASASTFDALLQAARSTDQPDKTNGQGAMTISDYLSACKGQSTMQASLNWSSLPDDILGNMEKSSTRPCRGQPTDHLRPSVKEGRSDVSSPHGDQSDDNHIRPDIHQSIRNAATRYAISEKLIQSVIQAESNYRSDAVSPAGAQGLMQLMPATARELGVSDPFDVDQNIDGGARYLRKMLDRFGGDIKLALAAYNAGPGTVQRYNGNVPYQETQTYIQRVLSNMAALGETIG